MWLFYYCVLLIMKDNELKEGSREIGVMEKWEIKEKNDT
jgi:hypothetical protein